MAFLHSPWPPEKIERTKEWLHEASRLLKLPESDPRWPLASRYLRALLSECEWQLSARSRAGSLSQAVDDLRRITNAAEGLHAALREACFSARALLEPENPSPGWPSIEYPAEVKTLWEEADGADLPLVVFAHSTWKFGATQELPSRWETRTEALATLARAIADRFDKQDTGGIRELFSGATGSFDLWLMGECARALARFGVRVGKGSILELARLISSFVHGEEPTPDWGVAHARRAAAWWKRFGPYSMETAFAQWDAKCLERSTETEPKVGDLERIQEAIPAGDLSAELRRRDELKRSWTPEMAELSRGPQALEWETPRGRKTNDASSKAGA